MPYACHDLSLIHEHSPLAMCQLTPLEYISDCCMRRTGVVITCISKFAVAGFSNAMANALVGRDYNTYGYACAGALGFGSRGSWTNAFNQVSLQTGCRLTAEPTYQMPVSAHTHKQKVLHHDQTRMACISIACAPLCFCCAAFLLRGCCKECWGQISTCCFTSPVHANKTEAGLS